MATTLQMRAAIVAELQAALEGVTVLAFHGDVHLDQLKTLIVRTPAVLVAALDTEDNEAQSHAIAEARRFGAFIVCGGPKPLERNDQALALVDLIEMTVQDNAWGVADASAPSRVRSRHLFNEALDAAAWALWLVDWSQPYDLGESDVASLNDLLRICGELDLADGNTAVDKVETRVEFTP